MFEVTLWPIIAGAIANLVIGFIWYHPKVLGTIWMRGARISEADMAAGQKAMPVTVVVSVLFAMLVGYVMNHFGIAWGVWDWIGAVELAIWTWLGFVVAPLLGSVLWERKPFSYFAINAGYWLISFIVIAVLLVVLA